MGAKIPSPANIIGATKIINEQLSPQGKLESQKSSQPFVALRTSVRESTALKLKTEAENTRVFELRTVIHSRFTVSVTGVSLGRSDAGPEMYLTFQDLPFSGLEFGEACGMPWVS